MTRAVHRFAFAGATAVVTGAGSGIGEALAHGLARRDDPDRSRGPGRAPADRPAREQPGVALQGRFDELALDDVDRVLALDLGARWC